MVSDSDGADVPGPDWERKVGLCALMRPRATLVEFE
jgi:hypothetical protein